MMLCGLGPALSGPFMKSPGPTTSSSLWSDVPAIFSFASAKQPDRRRHQLRIMKRQPEGRGCGQDHRPACQPA